jgi:uncharacterized MAPEG superfamily protein
MTDFAAHHAPTIWVTLAYIGLYYAFMIRILRVKLRVAKQCKEAGERFFRYSNQYPELLAADRVQLNMLEHMPPFLALLWLQSLTVSPKSAAMLGAAYIVVRLAYPLFLGPTLQKNIPLRIVINTFTGYGILLTFAVWQIAALAA